MKYYRWLPTTKIWVPITEHAYWFLMATAIEGGIKLMRKDS